MFDINHELLNKLFRDSKLTYKKLEEETDISRATLHNVMFGRHKPSYPVMCLINRALDLSQENIMDIYFPDAKSESEKEITI